MNDFWCHTCELWQTFSHCKIVPIFFSRSVARSLFLSLSVPVVAHAPTVVYNKMDNGITVSLVRWIAWVKRNEIVWTTEWCFGYNVCMPGRHRMVGIDFIQVDDSAWYFFFFLSPSFDSFRITNTHPARMGEIREKRTKKKQSNFKSP